MRRLVRPSAVAFLLAVSCAVACDSPHDAPKSTRVTVSASSTTALSVEGPSGTHLDVPVGATTTDVTIVMTVLPPTRRPAEAKAVVGVGVSMSPEGQTFEKAIEITLPITPSSLPAGKTIDDVVVVRAPQGSDAFVPMPTRRNGNAVVVSTEHFTDFVPVVLDPSSPFGTCTNHMCDPNETCGSCPFDCGLCLADVTPPSVVSIAPTDASTGVLGDAPVTVTFDEAVLAGSVDASSIPITIPSGIVPGTWSVNGSTATFTPTPSWPANAHVTVTVNSVRDLAGNAIAVTKVVAFDTADGTAESIVTPADNALDVDRGDPMLVIYDGPVDAASFTMQAAAGPCSGSVQVSADGFTTCLAGTVDVRGNNPEASLAVFPFQPPWYAPLQWRVLPSARDANHFSLGRPTRTFTTGDDYTSPIVVATSPTDGAVGVPKNASITLTFSEVMDPTSIPSSSYIVSVNSIAVPVSASFDFSQRVLTLTPMDPIPPGAHVYVSVTGMSDAAGLSSSSHEFSFDVVAPTTFVGSVPALGAVGVHPRQDVFATFTRDIVPATFTMQAADGPCSGTVQLTDDPMFLNCVGGTVTAVASPGSITVRATNSLALGGTYFLRVNGASDVAGIGFDPNANTWFHVSPTNGFAYRMVLGPTVPGGNLGGLAGADASCNSMLPGSRAFLGTSTRYPCSVADCGSGSTSMDWVLAPNTTYVTNTGALLFTTRTTQPIFDPPLANQLTTDSTLLSPIGLSSTWLPSGAASDCAGWTDSVAMTASVARTDATDGTFVYDSSTGCGASFTLRCVEQVPTTLPATH